MARRAMGRRAAAKELVLDAWSAISYKKPLRDEEQNTATGHFAKSWLSPEAARRLNAYMVLAAYDQNMAGHFITDATQEEIDDNREYGDAALIVDQVLAALLGETQEIVVAGAEDYDPKLEATIGARLAKEAEDVESPAVGEEPLLPEMTDDDLEQIEQNIEAERLADLQEALREWADDVHLELRMVDCERNAVALGDGVYLLGWDDTRGRPTAAVMDPGCYFPVLPDTIDQYEYPTKVHFAWQLDGSDYSDGKDRLRRLTYSVENIRWDIVEVPGLLNDDEAVAPEGTKVDSDGYLTKVYPWREDEPSRLACYFTDATWTVEDINDSHDVNALTFESATFGYDDDGNPLRDVDLGIDFLPVVHVPNTPPGGNHFGQSSLARVLQILDDLQSVDTDAQRASATTGSPTVVIHGAAAPEEPSRSRRALDAESPRDSRGGMDDGRVNLGPGDFYYVGESGGATVLETHEQLAELRNFIGSLRDRLSVNSRLPAAVLGTMKPSEAPSGYAIQLSFGPLSSMIRQMRLTRSVKYPLMLKQVHRLFQANDADNWPAGENPFVSVRFGSFLPSDMAGVLELVTGAHGAKLISLETAITMLLEAGFPIDDVAEEIARIQSRDYEGANALADAVGETNAIREYLGLPPIDPDQVQQPNLPDPPTPPVPS